MLIRINWNVLCDCIFLRFSLSTDAFKDVVREIIFVLMCVLYFCFFLGVNFVAINAKVKLLAELKEETKGFCGFFMNVFRWHVLMLYIKIKILYRKLICYVIRWILFLGENCGNNCFRVTENIGRVFSFVTSFIVSMIIS